MTKDARIRQLNKRKNMAGMIAVLTAAVVISATTGLTASATTNSGLYAGITAEDWTKYDSYNAVDVVEADTEIVKESGESEYFSKKDTIFLARMIFLECGNLSEEAQLACGSVILNRLHYGYSWQTGDTIQEVCSRSGQYSTYKKAVKGGFSVSSITYTVANELATNGVPKRYEGLLYQSAHSGLGVDGFQIDGEWFSYGEK